MRKVLLLALLLGQIGCEKKPNLISIAFVPRLPYAQALVGFGRKDFQKIFSGKPVVLPRYLNETGMAGRDMLEKNADMAYMDSVEAIRLCLKTKGQFVIVSGAVLGGGALVVDKSLPVTGIQDFRDKQVGTPTFGCLHNMTARVFFAELGFLRMSRGGDFLLSTVPEDLQAENFEEKRISAFWTGEPWVSLLTTKHGARIFMDESELWRQWVGTKPPTVVLVVRKSLLEKFPQRVIEIIRVHTKVTQWINANPREAMALCQGETARLTGKTWSEKSFNAAWSRLEFAYDIPMPALERQALYAWRIGLLGTQPEGVSTYFEKEVLAKALK